MFNSQYVNEFRRFTSDLEIRIPHLQLLRTGLVHDGEAFVLRHCDQWDMVIQNLMISPQG